MNGIFHCIDILFIFGMLRGSTHSGTEALRNLPFQTLLDTQLDFETQTYYNAPSHPVVKTSKM